MKLDGAKLVSKMLVFRELCRTHFVMSVTSPICVRNWGKWAFGWAQSSFLKGRF